MYRNRASRRPAETPASPALQGSAGQGNRSRWLVLAAAGFLSCLVGAVFFPVWQFELVDYDVTGQVVNNEHVRALNWENLKHIFTSRCVTSYYPIRTLSFALDYRIWGLHAGGYKLTSGLIHLVNVHLVFWLALRLCADPAASVQSAGPRRDLFLATFSAGLFAVHPLVVESVVWVAGREELLMTLGALGCIHFYITARRLGTRGDGSARALACYVLATLCCAAACLSNAVGAVIPLLVTTWDLLTLARPKLWRIVRGTAALWVIGAATIVIKKLGRGSVYIIEVEPFSLRRLLLVLELYWLNLKSIVWPVELAPSRAKISPQGFLNPNVILGCVAVVLTCLLIWWLWRRKAALFGLLWFGLALAPGSQIMVHHIHRADRFLYLPLAGLALAVAMGLRPAGRFPRRPAARIGLAAVGLWGLLFLGILSAGQVQTWQNSVTMWANCVRVEPGNAFAHFALAVNQDKRGRTDQALLHRQAQLELDFNTPGAMHCAAMLAMKGTGEQPPNYELAVQLARRACQLDRGQTSGYLDTLAMALSGHARSLVDAGQLRRAIENYHSALKADPDCQPALFQLATVLATCRVTKLRNPQEAVRLAERAAKSMDRSDPTGWIILATVYAEAWEFDKAIAATEKAIQLVQGSGGPTGLVDELRRRLELHRKRVPPESLR